MRIGFDLDGVLYPWHKYVYDDMAKIGKVDVKYDYFWNSGMWKWNDYQKLLEIYASKESMYTRSLEGYIHQALKALAKVGAIFYIVSQRPENCAIETVNWVKEYVPGVCEGIFVCKDKISILKEIHNYYPLDYYIEDRTELAGSISKLGIETLLITTPYNRDDTYSGKRFDSVHAAINHIIYNREAVERGK
jgi:uncharacterized HAD superfamily protein